MDIKDLEKLLETTDDKYAVLSNRSNLIPYKLTLGDLKDLLGKFLLDEEKARIRNKQKSIHEKEYSKKHWK